MKKLKTIILISTLVMIMVVTGCSSGGSGLGGAKTFNLSTGVDADFMGLDTKGTANLTFDEEILLSEFSSELGIMPDTNIYELEESDPETYEKLTKIDKLYYSIELKLDKIENLSNGDIVTVMLDYNEPLAEELGYEFELSKPEYEVSGLQEPTIITKEDLFKDVEVEFVGVSPKAKVAIKNNSDDEILKNIAFYAEKESDLKKGDTVIIYPDIDHSYLERKGYIIEESTKEYTVENVDEYITSFDQITDEVLEEITKQSYDYAKTFLSPSSRFVMMKDNNDKNLNTHDAEIGNLKINNAYFFKNKQITKQEMDTGPRNSLFVCFTFDIEHYEHESWDDHRPTEYKDMNMFTYLSNFIITKDGEVEVDIMDLKTNDDVVTIDQRKFEDYVVTRNLSNFEYEEIEATEFPEQEE